MKKHILAKAIPSVSNNGNGIKVGALIEFCEPFKPQKGPEYPSGSKGRKTGGDHHVHLVEMTDGVVLHVPRRGFQIVAR